MTEDEARQEIHDLKERVEDLENEREAIKNLPDSVAQLHGAVNTLKELVLGRLDGIAKNTEPPSRTDTIIKFAATVLAPVLVALITGYFLVKASVPSGAK